MRLLIILFVFFCSSCSRMPDHMKTGYTMINKHLKNMASEHNWEPEAIGGSFYGGDIKALFSAVIIIVDQFDIHASRKLLVDGSKKFLNTINKNENAPVHLNHFPFKNEDIEYSIALYSPDSKYLGYVHLLKGKIFYRKADEFDHLVDVHKETYAEALELLKSDHADVASKD